MFFFSGPTFGTPSEKNTRESILRKNTFADIFKTSKF